MNFRRETLLAYRIPTPMPPFGRALAVLLALLMGPTPASAQVDGGRGLSAFQSERMERFLEDRVACRGCHVIAGRGGAIGPVLDGLSTRADTAYVLSVVSDPSRTIPGTTMPHQPMPPVDAARLVRYLMSLPTPATSPEPSPQAPPALGPGDETDGAALYARHCAACHGTAGQGDGWNAENLPVRPTAHADATLMSRRPDDTLFDGIAGGGYVLDRSPRMPGFASLLRPEQIRALVSHIRTLCDCTQPSWAGQGQRSRTGEGLP